jgi:hypothetical protein
MDHEKEKNLENLWLKPPSIADAAKRQSLWDGGDYL